MADGEYCRATNVLKIAVCTKGVLSISPFMLLYWNTIPASSTKKRWKMCLVTSFLSEETVLDKTLTPSPWTTQMDYPKMD